jgi:hypothetical protein
MSLIELLPHIGKKPGFYIPVPGQPGQDYRSIWHLNSFVSGYICGKQSGNDKEGIESFTFWVCTRYRVPTGAGNWAVHLWWQCGEDDKKAFELFFELFDEFVRDLEGLGPDTVKARYLEMERQLRNQREI